MGGERWFYGSEAEFRAIYERLKGTPCPHCKVVGALILHGFLRGYDECSPRQKTVRARRVFCSNRHARPGCGRTFSVWMADKIRRLSLTAAGVWRFLQLVVSSGMHAAVRALDCHLSDRALERIWKRFDLGQSKIRTALSRRCRPPDLTAPEPAAQVLAHLLAAFPKSRCPVAAFQQNMHTFFL